MKKKLTEREAQIEIKNLRRLLSDKTIARTASEWASLRGRLGGLLGRNSPGRSLGGKRGCAKRWGSESGKTIPFIFSILLSLFMWYLVISFIFRVFR